MSAILKRGMSGADVLQLQTILIATGHPVATDGIFGSGTEAAVRAFQRELGLSVDGVVGPATWAALLHPGARPATPGRAPFPEKRCWPLRCLVDGRKPQITSGHVVRNPSRPKHYGVDLFYAYRDGIDPPKKIGDSGRTKTWWIPENTYACAPFDGRVVFASDSPTGMRVWLQHESGWAAGFFHFDHLRVNVGQVLLLGDPVGRVNDNPVDKGDADHLHFEMYWGDIGYDVAHGRYPIGTVDAELMLEKTTLYLPAAA